MTRIAVDTNVIVYGEGIDDPRRRDLARDSLATIASFEIVIPVQVLGETLRVLLGKARWPLERALKAVRSFEEFELARTDAEVWREARQIIDIHRLPVWDSVILAAASQAGCALLLSEDYQDGFVWRGVTVVDPFAERRHPLLESLMTPRDRS